MRAQFQLPIPQKDAIYSESSLEWKGVMVDLIKFRHQNQSL